MAESLKRKFSSILPTGQEEAENSAQQQQPDWCELLQTCVSVLILKRLPATDIIRCRAVCSSWNKAVLSFVSSPVYSSLPLLMFHDHNGPGHGRQQPSLNFLSLVDNKSFKVKINIRDYWWMGVSHGWLVILDEKGDDLHLLNPFSAAKIFLPSTKSLMIRFPVPCVRVILSSKPSSSSSSKGFSAAILYGFDRQHIAFCKHGDNSWTTLVAPRSYFDMICHNGWIYAITNPRNTVDILDFDGLLHRTVALHARVVVPERNQGCQVCKMTYLVESLGEILVVERARALTPNCSLRVIGFMVYKLNFGEKTKTTLQTLSGRAILIGKDQAISVSTQDFPQIEGDSIYFLEDGCDHMRVYNLKEEKFRESQCGEQFKIDRRYSSSSFWLVPDLQTS